MYCRFGIIVIFGYVNFLNLLHEDEQNKLKQAQGEYYFSDTFDGVLFEPDEQDHMLDINVEKDQPEQSFYEKIREHNALNK